MYFQILKVILWSRQQTRKPRIVALKPGCVNVISGASRTGKSAIVPVIDYCLGAEQCAIPVETIRIATEWFGVLVSTADGQKLLARREPGEQRSTSDMFVLEGSTVAIPDRITERNTSSDVVKNRLDELAGLSRLSFDFDGSGSGFKNRPSFRDLMAFNFQPQNIVANPDVLFFKADTYDHREKLKSVFPYVLGAVTAATMAAKHESEFIGKQLAQKEREVANIRRVTERWASDLRAWALQAREYGLIADTLPENATRDELLELLRNAVEWGQPSAPNVDGVTEVMDELVALQKEEALIDSELQSLRRRLVEMTQLKENASRLDSALAIQRDRLAVSQWLSEFEESHRCPVCESELSEASTEVPTLVRALSDIEQSISSVSSAPASFDRELLRVRQQMVTSLEKMRGIGGRIKSVRMRSDEAQSAHYRESEMYRFLGMLKQSLQVQQSVSDDGQLMSELEALRKRYIELNAVIRESEIEARKQRALRRISSNVARILPTLDAERPSDPVSLSLVDLTIKVAGQNRDDFLWEIGSGANWLSYHVAVSLALQQFFLASRDNPVPSFLVYDQPSQVYFPRHLASKLKSNLPSDAKDEKSWGDEDTAAVRKVFQTLSNVVTAAEGKLQVLVLDHAGPNVWGGIPNVELVEEWRDGLKLVPEAWLLNR